MLDHFQNLYPTAVSDRDFSASSRRLAGGWAQHPLGTRCGGVADIVPERYDRATLDDAISLVPQEVIANAFLIGTPAQVTAQLRQFGEEGLRHVVLVPLSALVTMGDFAYTAWAIRRIARSLRSG